MDTPIANDIRAEPPGSPDRIRRAPWTLSRFGPLFPPEASNSQKNRFFPARGSAFYSNLDHNTESSQRRVAIPRGGAIGKGAIEDEPIS